MKVLLQVKFNITADEPDLRERMLVSVQMLLSLRKQVLYAHPSTHL